MKHVVLTGFMAVGKTAVGKRLARRLGWDFYDTDELIERRTGRSIPELFACEGEPYFRSLEREVVASLRPPRPSVIATGGGTFVDSDNRRHLRALGIVVCLVTSIETVLARVGRSNKRPLAVRQGREGLERLFRERMPAYRQADVLVETDGLTIEQSVARILAMIEPRLRGEASRDPGR
ncbi:MAG: shikimate kinase [Candidatus Dadabacteria bacterium]|nr:MAG: shikimate kinase [Candidatus Dadabacteria bacterium]